MDRFIKANVSVGRKAAGGHPGLVNAKFVLTTPVCQYSRLLFYFKDKWGRWGRPGRDMPPQPLGERL